MKILVTGGAGYIGSATVKRLCDLGHMVSVFDNLEKGIRALVDDRAHFCEVSTLDVKAFSTALMNDIRDSGKVDAIIHFAARKDAGESMIRPELYTENITGLANVLECAHGAGIKKIIFSSSAAVYGDTLEGLIDETAPCAPTNYYGYTKLAGEHMLSWYSKLGYIEYVALRYFNVAGDAGLRYVDPNAKNIFNSIGDVIIGKRDVFSVYGNDYNTPDGTGVRDYVHVSDLVEGHIRALDVEGSHVINLGTSTGYSVHEILAEFEKVTGKEIPTNIIARRSGDVAKLIASNGMAREVLGWEAKHTLRDMVESTVRAYTEKQ
jgi:UDP-glucose 4-epimerase